MIDYNNIDIYIIYNDDYYYIKSSTQSITHFKSTLINNYKKYIKTKRHFKPYFNIIKSQFNIEIIDNIKCKDKQDLNNFFKTYLKNFNQSTSLNKFKSLKNINF
jgi:predicted nucleotidyltransferase